MSRGHGGRGIGIASLAVFLLAASGASASTIKVTNPSDPGTGTPDCATTDLNCSLRQAITAASSGDTVLLPAGKYMLAQEGPVITTNIRLIGAGARTTTIDQTALDSNVIGVQSGVTATISGITITGGNGTGVGAGIFDSGTLTLKDSTVTKNEADGYTIDTCFFPQPPCPSFLPGVGGGIYAVGGGPLTIINSTIDLNSAKLGTGQGADGGGIYTDDPLTIINSTIADNSLDGGGFVSNGGGIGMTGQGHTALDLANTTLAFNSAGATGVGGNLDVNGSGITSAVRDTVIASGSAATGENCAGATLTSEGYNLEDRNQCGFTQPSDLHVANAHLGQPTNHGGPTDTVALLPSSTAINAGNPQGCTDLAGHPLLTDQRGVPRPQGTRCDIGAFEFKLATVGAPPRISGQPKPGDTLTCQLPLVVSTDGPDTQAVTWLRGSVQVGAGLTYKVRAEDANHSLHCRLVVTDAAGPVTRTSDPVKIASPPKPSVTITLVDISGHEATFKFTTQRATSTECALAKGAASAPFTACTSPKHYRRLTKGEYAFYVRAVGPGGTSDPAQHTFRIS
jgi:hypothetical protein